MEKIKKKIQEKEVIIFSIAVLAIVVGLFFFDWLLFPRFNLIGESTLEIPYGQNYSEPGFSASFRNQDITDRVSTKNNIDPSQLGTYEVEYTLEYDSVQKNLTRTILVVDKQSPEITLSGVDPGLFCTNQEYREEGFQAIDNYDGDITDKVEKNEVDGEIEYKVADSSGNQAISHRSLRPYKDNMPTIGLTGDTVQLIVGTNFTDPGYIATDICDGDITKNVKTENDINKDKIGTYKVKYSVTNSNNKTSTLERIVKVKPLPINENGIIYLTFDDGPSTLTPQVLDILKSEGVKATFFVIGRGDPYNYIIKRASDEGHTIGIHSFTHNYQQIYSSESAFYNDLYSIQNKVEKIIGKKPHFTRFPGGSSNTVSKFNPGIMTKLTKSVSQKGFTYFDWNVSSGDAGDTKSRWGVYNYVVSGLSHSRSNIVLLHDSGDKTYTVQALRDIIRFGKNNGYVFAAISDATSPITHRVNN